MNYSIKNAVVIGSGTMGAAIAAHLANARVPVTLLDIVPGEISDAEKKKGLTLKDKAVRNRIVQEGLDRCIKARPANFMSSARIDMVKLGNLEDDFEAVREADWIIEVIVENLAIKQSLMARIDEIRKENAIVSTNTSGIPVASIADGRTESFKQHFLGTHFFNPPRYLKLLEIIPTPDTLPNIVEFISQFGAKRLGKGVVYCKDTPNFIANRVGSVGGAFAMNYILEHGYTVPEVDAITGPIMGRPKTATFRLLDLVGIDVANHVRSNLAALIPEDEVAQSVLNSKKGSEVTNSLIEKGWLGNKTQVGIYKTVRGEDGGKEFWPLDLNTLEHVPPGEKVRFDSIGKVKDIDDLGKRLKALIAEEDRAAQLAKAMIFHGLSYASRCVPEIADLPSSIDDAVRWGFMHENGPFEIWDALGVAETKAEMEKAGYSVASWIDEMLASGQESFYQYQGSIKTGVYAPAENQTVPLMANAPQVSLVSQKEKGKIVNKNDSATLIDLGDGVACVEFHTKMNALDTDIGLMIDEALDCVDKEFDALVIGNEADNFSAGANIFMIVMQAQQGQWEEIDAAISGLQDLNMKMRYFHKPVVVAPAGMALGGGAEVIMHASRVVSAAELYAGLVELGVGVIPAGGGTKEMVRRILTPPMLTENSDPLPFLEKIFMQVGTAKVATSALEAQEFAILGPQDRIVMDRSELLAEAKREARHMADSGYTPPVREKIYAAGRDQLAALRMGIYMFREGNYITEYDVVVAKKLACVMTGGELSQPAWVDEQVFLDLEREAFLSLCGEERTQQRMWHTLQTGKPLRN